jgi:hypothetical protein
VQILESSRQLKAKLTVVLKGFLHFIVALLISIVVLYSDANELSLTEQKGIQNYARQS